MPTTAKQTVILGTAGHIDHGKSSLVRSLTGIDPDRLPEEKRRGITIDLGFAHLGLPDADVGIVDVPGHERFVRNMVAGATGIDLGLLVVAADDSVMPQTREHLAILDLLGVPGCVVVVTKMDLVDQDYFALVREEIRELLATTRYAGAKILGVSSVTGEGLEELRSVLNERLREPLRTSPLPYFRMPIDRVFSLQGHGTVVTGTVMEGECKVGDNLVALPSGLPVRVRRLQTHGTEAAAIGTGQRGAINLAGVHREDLRRGDELSVPGFLEPSRRLLVKAKMLSASPRPLRDRELVRLHLGTREVTTRVILKGRSLPPGDEACFELRSKEPVLAQHGQRFILRGLSPVVTLGGGGVLDPSIAPRRRIVDPEGLGQRLARTEPSLRLAALLEDNDLSDFSDPALACRLGIDPAGLPAFVDQLRSERVLLSIGTALLHRTRRDVLGKRIVELCRRELKRRQPARRIERSFLIARSSRLAGPAVVEAIVADLVSRHLLRADGDEIGLMGEQVQLTRNQRRLLDDLTRLCGLGGVSPPMLGEIAKELNASPRDVESIAKVAQQDGLLVRVGDGLFLAPSAVDTARQQAVAWMRQHGPATVAQLRDAWKVSRKHAVPLCEYFDAAQVTVRKGDTRVPGPRADDSTVEG